MHRPTLLAAALAASLALAACSGGSVRPASDVASAGGGDTFVYASNLDVVTDWDPATSYSNEVIAMENVYESLTRYDPATKKVEPRLATSWTSGDAGKTWTFTLRSGVRFHNGRALDAAAAKGAIERTIALKGGPAYIWGSVTSIDATSPTTLVFHLKYAAPLDLIASSAYAAYIYDTKAAASGDLKTWLGSGRDAGSGPYTVAAWNKGQETEVKLAAFPGYWGGWSGAHYKNVEFRVTPQLTTAWQLLQRGDVSFVERLNPQIFAQAKSTKGVQTSETQSFQNLLALFNTASGPMADLRVRQAVQKVVDEDGLIAALKGADAPATGIVPQGLLGYTPELTLRQVLTAAKSLLAQAGYGPGKKSLTLTMTYAQGDDDQQLFATLLGSALTELGVKLDAKPLQWNAQWGQGKSTDPAKRQDIFVMYWYPDYADAFSWFTNIFHSANPPYFNLSYLKDPKVDATIDKLPQLTATNSSAAAAVYAALQRELIQTQAVVAPLYVQNYQRAYSSKMTGYTDNPAYPNVVFVHDVTPGG